VGSTTFVNFTTSRKTRYATSPARCHVNWVVCDSDWEAEFARVAEAHPRVLAYVKNQGLGLEVPYRDGAVPRKYLPDFSWLSLGIDVRGRSFSLKVNYRTSHQIRRRVDVLLPRQIRDVDGYENSRARPISVFEGPEPIIRTFRVEAGEIAFVGEWRSIGGRRWCET
jgi:hypothetical protein